MLHSKKKSRKQYHKALFLLPLRVQSTRRGKPVSKRVRQLLTWHTVRKRREGSWRSDSSLFSPESQHMEWYQPQFGWVFPPQSTQYVKKLSQSAHSRDCLQGHWSSCGAVAQLSAIANTPRSSSSKCLHQASVIVTKPDV